MKRRNFVQLSGMGAASLLLPTTIMGNNIHAEALLEPGMDVLVKKRMADVALNTAKSMGATYADARIGRYLNQYVFTREDKVQNVVNTESFGIGIRVIANGTWGFASTNSVTEDGIKNATMQAIAIAKANSKIQTEPVILAPVAAYGEVSWKTPIKKDFKEVPVSEKVDLLLNANAAAMDNGANFVNSALFMVNEQKYFASTDGSYIDQDVHRIWPTFGVTAVDRGAGAFKTRQAMSAPMGLGYEYMDGLASEKLEGPAGITLYRKSYDIVEDAVQAAKQATEMLTAKSVDAGKYDLVLEPNHLGLTIHESVGHP
jgi:TldD protein